MDIGQEELKRFFEENGITPKSVRIIFDQNGKPRGFGFADFHSEEDAQKAVALSGTRLDGKIVNVKDIKQ